MTLSRPTPPERDAIDRLPSTGERGLSVERKLAAQRVEHPPYDDTNGEDLPEIRNRPWSP
jgi:xylulose-5-phosphate/fructose-6-phosphate phosphoketolase